jgi:hypothetical protein
MRRLCAIDLHQSSVIASHVERIPEEVRGLIGPYMESAKSGFEHTLSC